MSLGKRLINTGAEAACNTDSVQVFGADSTYSSNIALYQLDGNDDDTTGNYDGTSDTGVTYSSTGAKFGQAASFNGSNSEITVNSFASLTQVGISMWVNMPDISQQAVLIARYGTNREFAIYMYGGTLTASIYYNGNNGNATSITTSTYMSNDTWHHIAYTANGSTAPKLYIDGIEVGTPQYTASAYCAYYTSSEPLDIGYGLGVAAYHYEGKIDQVRIFNKALTAERVATLYAETSSTASNTNPFDEGAGVALYTLDYDASEASGYYDGTPSNVDFGVEGKINTGVRFKDATDSFISTSLLFTGTGAKSFSFWFKANSVSSTNSAFYFSNNGGRIDVHIAGTGSNTPSASYQTVSINSTTAITGWNFVTLVFSGWLSSYSSYSYHGPAITCKVYLNGGSVQTVSPLPYNGSKELHLGGLSGSSSNYDGSLDQFRVFNKELSTDEIDTLYAETACTYTATTTNSDYPTTNAAYYKLDNSAEDSKGTNDGTESNIEYRFGRFGQAAKFPALASSYINTGITSLGSDFSLSFWFNPDYIDGSAGYRAPLGKYYSGSGDAELLLGFYDNGDVITYIYYGGGTSNSVSHTHTTTVSNGNWYHYCLTWEDGVALKTYIDTVATTTTTSQTKNTNTVPLYIGALDSRAAGDSSYNAYAWSGFIDQVRIFSTTLSSSQVSELYNEKPETDTSNFKTVLYEGTAANQYISNVGMDLETSGGLVWIKNRSNSSGYYHALIDSVRGVGKVLSSNTATIDSTTYTDQLTSLDANGFFVGNNSSGGNYVNLNGDDYVAWAWKGGGDAVTDNSGDVSADISANTDLGFSIVKYNDSGTGGQTVAHGLNSAPTVMITKTTDTATDWVVYTTLIDGGMDYLKLNDDVGAAASSLTVPTSQFIYSRGQSSTSIINYLFHSKSGVSKMGTYSGNGSTTGPITYTTDNGASDGSNGFEPQFLMVKRTDADNFRWVIWDNKRDTSNTRTKGLSPDLSSAEITGFDVDFLSNGFQLKDAETTLNASGGTYLYMAFK